MTSEIAIHVVKDAMLFYCMGICSVCNFRQYFRQSLNIAFPDL